jgi:hypothetical protein
MAFLEEHLQELRTVHTRLQASFVPKHAVDQFAKSKDGKKLRESILMQIVDTDGAHYLGVNHELVEELLTLAFQARVAIDRGKDAQVQYASKLANKI